MKNNHFMINLNNNQYNYINYQIKIKNEEIL